MTSLCKRTSLRCPASRLWLPITLLVSNSHSRLLRFEETHYGEIVIHSGETGPSEVLDSGSRHYRTPGPGGSARPVAGAVSAL
jgi:hypothetical protein